MPAIIEFEFPWAWLCALPLAGVIAWAALRQRRRGVKASRVLSLAVLRGLAVLPLVFLAARPVSSDQEPPTASSRPVIVLMDRSESMSLQDRDRSRYSQALDFLRAQLLPALKSAGVPVRGMLFDQSADQADGDQFASAAPKGKRTNLAGAIAQAIGASPRPPLAVVALTDGIANQTAENARAVLALADAPTPFIGVGFGSDQGVQTLSLHEVEAPAMAAPRAAFTVAARLEMMNGQDIQGFDLVLFRDGQVWRKKNVTPGKGSRTWLEGFEVNEAEPGMRHYAIQMLPPDLPNLKCVNTTAEAAVRISDQQELRVLYIQGALTWDYKFIHQALRQDRTIKLTGLTRTSKESVFRQNVENAGELVRGFPESIEELAPFRVVVLSNLRSADLSPEQQEMLARFCGELGGGVLMIGGPSTFDTSWQGSRLEQLLPVTFSSAAGVTGLDQPFRLELTEEALQNPIFRVAEESAVRETWAKLPTFTQYGRLDAAKPGAQVWICHPVDEGPQGKRILMAAQRYGAGLAAVFSVQSFWRWRLAKEADAPQFDRFWRQLFRFLSEVGRQEVAIALADQDLRPQADVQVLLEKQPNPQNLSNTNQQFIVRVENTKKQLIQEQRVELEPLHPVEFSFPAARADRYTVTVLDPLKVPIASRPIEIRDLNVEFQNTARNMETLRQFASVSDGLAFKAEECPVATDLVAQIRGKVEEVRRGKEIRRVVGVNGWTLAWVLSCLSAGWLLRKKWGLL